MGSSEREILITGLVSNREGKNENSEEEIMCCVEYGHGVATCKHPKNLHRQKRLKLREE